MGLLIPIVFFQRLRLCPVILAGILTLALSAPRPQSIPGFAAFAKLTLSLPLFASGASLHFGLSFSVSYGQSLPVLQLYRLAKIRGFISYSSTLFAKVLWLCNKFSIHFRVTLLNAKANQETEVLIVSAMR